MLQEIFESPMADPMCSAAVCCGCFMCVNWELRRRALKYDMSKYKCCQVRL